MGETTKKQAAKNAPGGRDRTVGLNSSLTPCDAESRATKIHPATVNGANS
jgi:hypothetical protein